VFVELSIFLLVLILKKMRKEKCAITLERFVKNYKNLERKRVSWRGHQPY